MKSPEERMTVPVHGLQEVIRKHGEQEGKRDEGYKDEEWEQELRSSDLKKKLKEKKRSSNYQVLWTELCLPQNLQLEIPTPSVSVFRDGDLGK